MNHKLIKLALKSTIPVLAGYIVLGIGFGILLKAAGYGMIWAFVMSVCIYAGSMQYLAVNLLTSGASLITVAITTLMVNARHLFYGISMIDKYKGAGKKKPYMMFALTDETYSLVCNEHLPEGVNAHSYYFLVSLFNQIYWIIGCVTGSLIGSIITFNAKGIDFALTALFITIFVEQWRSTKDHTSAIIGVTSSVICLLVFGSQSFLIPSMITITVALTLMKKKGGCCHE